MLIACNNQTNDQMIEEFKAEVVKTEQDFAELVKEKGVSAGFLAFADENAVLKRGEKLIKGKAEIQKYFEAQDLKYKDVKLEWSPDFVEVAQSGDLAYTYGKATYSVVTTDGQIDSGAGLFHTVWKRQADGTWKYVWD